MRIRVITRDIKVIVTGTYTILCNIVDDYIDMFEDWAEKATGDMEGKKKNDIRHTRSNENSSDQ